MTATTRWTRRFLTTGLLVGFGLNLLSTAQEISVGGGSDFPEIYNSEPEPGDPISPEEALAALELPEGFSASLFAAEPDVQNPIAACTDAAGRVWIAENYTYAERAQRFDLSLNDRVVVLEDADGDGVAEKRTVFTDSVKMLTGITVGRGGVWLMCPPQLLFVPDADGDLVPDGPPQVMLDGFTVAKENYHNFANGLSWGPDNWLYGRCGASCAGEMGLPGSIDEQRVPIRGGMWRYHPERQAFETLTHGTTNPWGHDWNDKGDLFFINTVNGHLWHAIPGAHFVRAHTMDINPHIYELIDMHADHWHFDTGKSWTASRDGAADDYGGGHAHIGMMIYQEDAWPTEFSQRLMTVNMHGRRINTEILARDGSGYVASHGADFVKSRDTWFRGMEILPLSDGNILMVDWSDTGECHDSTGVHRTSGRAFKISYRGQAENASAETAAASLAVLKSNVSGEVDVNALVDLQFNSSSWASRRARELMAAAASSGHLEPRQIEDAEVRLLAALNLDAISEENYPVVELQLRALWSLAALNRVSPDLATRLLDSPEESLRSWGVRLRVDDLPIDMSDGRRAHNAPATVPDALVQRFVQLATMDPSAAVRLQLASALQRLPHQQRPALASALMQHDGDADDHNLPLMTWFGLTPLGEQHIDALVSLCNDCKWPTARRLLARRIADQSKVAPQALDRLISLSSQQPASFQRDIAVGVAQALAGWRQADEPEGWSALAESLSAALQSTPDEELKSALQNLGVLFGDGRTVDELMRVAADNRAELELRQSALQSLVDSRAAGIKNLCLELLSERFLNNVAAAGLARENDASVGAALVDAYKRFHPFDRSQVVSILTTRASWAESLLKAVAAGKLERDEISPFQARQIASLDDASVSKLLAENWGQVRSTPKAKQDLMTRLKTELTAEVLAKADKSVGRKLFDKSCSSCHKLFGAGGAIGPDLTGAQRSNLDYLLENIVDPSAVVTKEFRATVILLDDDRVLSGLVTSKSENVVTLATQEQTYNLATDEIVQMKLSENSTMPEGLLEQFSPSQIQSLFAYLQSQGQVD